MSNKKYNPLYVLTLIRIAVFGILGAIVGLFRGAPLNGFLWGISIGIVIMLASLVVFFGWDGVKNQMKKNRLAPYILVGILLTIGLLVYFALNFGKS